MGFKLTILGSSAAVPTKYRSLSAQVLEHEQILFLIDCGEGTQLQMMKYEIKRNRIDHIFISHLHGDHYFGLAGLLNTLGLEKREKPIFLYAPQALKEYLNYSFSLSGRTGLSFPLHFIGLEEGGVKTIFENNRLQIESFPLIHSIPTWGFIFREKEKDKNIKHDFIREYHPDYLTIKSIKKGADFIDDKGNILSNEEITRMLTPPVSYAYFSDTTYDVNLSKPIHAVDVLYHEATFSDAETELASERLHSTARQAAMLAKQAQIKQLLLGHISARFLNDTSALELQAREVFQNSFVVEDGDEYNI